MEESKMLEKQKDFVANLLAVSQVANQTFLIKISIYLLFADSFLQVSASKSLNDLKWDSLPEIGLGSVVIFVWCMSFFLFAMMGFLQQSLDEFFLMGHVSHVEPYDHKSITLKDAKALFIETKDDRVKELIDEHINDKADAKSKSLDALSFLVLLVCNLTIGFGLSKQTLTTSLIDQIMTLHFALQIVILGILGVFLVYLCLLWWVWISRNRDEDDWIYAPDQVKPYRDKLNSEREAKGEVPYRLPDRKKRWTGIHAAFFFPLEKVAAVGIVGWMLAQALRYYRK